MLNFLLVTGVTGSIMILLLLVLRRVFRGSVSPRLGYAAWLAAAFCLLLPFRVASPASVMNALPRWQGPAALAPLPSEPEGLIGPDGHGSEHASQQGEGDLGEEAQNDRTGINGGIASQGAPRQPDGRAFSWTGLLFGVWAAGAGLTAAYILASNLFFCARVRRSARTVALNGELGRWAGRYRVAVSRAVPSPCLVGIARPRIVVTPAALEEEGRLRHVITHELCHAYQRDNWWAILRSACLTVHWFNPLVWVAAAVSKEDCELSCDYLALRMLGEEERLPYGETLISFLRAKPTASSLVNTATAMAQSKRKLRVRISMIARKPRVLMGATFLAAAIVLSACVVTLTGPEEEVPQPVGDVLESEQEREDQLPQVTPEPLDPIRQEFAQVESFLPQSRFRDMTEEEMDPYLSQFGGDFTAQGRTDGNGNTYLILEYVGELSFETNQINTGELYTADDERYVEFMINDNTTYERIAEWRIRDVEDIYCDQGMLKMLVESQGDWLRYALGSYSRTVLREAELRGLERVTPEYPYLELQVFDTDLIERTSATMPYTFYLPLQGEDVRTAEGIRERIASTKKTASPSGEWYRSCVSVVFGEEESYTLCGGEEPLLWDGRSLNLKNARFWKDEEGAEWMRELVRSALGYDPIGYAKDWFDVELASAHLSFPVYVEDGEQIRWDYRDQTIADEEKLRELAELFRNAKLNEDGKCPMTAPLTLTRADGETRVVYIAADSCDTALVDGDVYMSYGKQSDLFEIFDQIMGE